MPLATRLVKKQTKKAIKGSITTCMEYADGQLVGVRDPMASAKATDGESRSTVLQDVCMASFVRISSGFAHAPLI
jgi:hypothetical protein